MGKKNLNWWAGPREEIIQMGNKKKRKIKVEK